MKPFTLNIEINVPRSRVIEAFDNPDNMVKWQKNLRSFEHVSGERGLPGAVSRLTYDTKGGPMELTEVITLRNLPDEFSGRYEWHNGFNTMVNRFTEPTPESTRWEATVEYHFKGFLPNLMGLVAPGIFRSQTLDFMENFKAFCETGADVRDAVSP